MPHPPAFWRPNGPALWSALLAPLSAVTAGVTALRLRRRGWEAPIPVICVGNVTVGGAGKTTVALDLVRRLLARGRRVHVLLRGYGERGPRLDYLPATAAVVDARTSFGGRERSLQGGEALAA